MMPIGTLGGGRPPRRSIPPRIAFLAVVTVVAVGLLAWGSLRGDDRPSPDRSGPAAASRRRSPTSTAASGPTETTVYQFLLDPSWPPKGSSRYSESEESKLQSDELQQPTTTTTAASGGGDATGGGTTTSSARRGTATSAP
jgi:hypothetical protein